VCGSHAPPATLKREKIMANGNDSGGIGLLGVLLGALIVVGIGFLFLNNWQGSGGTPTVKVEAPRVLGK
jgi:hypothetical protein